MNKAFCNIVNTDKSKITSRLFESEGNVSIFPLPS